MEIYYFLSIVLVVVSILQIILFFKVWGMTNDVDAIKISIGATDNFSSLAWMGSSESAYRSLCKSMLEELESVMCWSYIKKGELNEIPEYMNGGVKSIESIIDRYEGKFIAIGEKMPEHLSSVSKMNEFGLRLNS